MTWTGKLVTAAFVVGFLAVVAAFYAYGSTDQGMECDRDVRSASDVACSVPDLALGIALFAGVVVVAGVLSMLIEGLHRNPPL